MGINGHYHFKPELYSQVCRLVRNYHNLNWDVAKPGDPITIPRCVNKVDWDAVYGPWNEKGFEISLCAMFGSFGESREGYASLWQGKEDWMETYGHALASHFAKKKGWVTSLEIDNEPGADFDDKLYQRLFVHMAKGIRRADPGVKIVTATTHAGPADDYSKNLTETFGCQEMLPLYDVINLHVYPTKPKQKGRSPWERSYPEDPEIDWLRIVDQSIAWRNQHAPGKEVWITEFGYDSCTPEAMKNREGWALKLDWRGVSDVQQARYLVRSFLAFAERDLARAYLYFYNDEDKASVHAASGLTRNFQPKPSFWAVRHFYQTLGDCRHVRSRVGKDIERFQEFQSDSGKTVWVLWLATGGEETREIVLNHLPSPSVRAFRMPLAEGDAPAVALQRKQQGIRLEIGPDPTYLIFD